MIRLEYNLNVQPSSLFFILFLVAIAASAMEDDDAIDTLKIEANHNVERLKSYKKETTYNKIFENEREKGLGEYFEEQEKWDLIRERGLSEYKKSKGPSTPDETSIEYKRDQKEKAEADKRYELSREALVRTRDKIRRQQPSSLSLLEEEELQLLVDRPRYDVRKKRQNKWTSSGGSKFGGSTGSAPSFQNNASPPVANDFVPPPPPPDFPAAPAPYEGFEELPPPPMYDNSMNTGVPYDPSFGGEMAIPPPPPPPPDYNF